MQTKLVKHTYFPFLQIIQALFLELNNIPAAYCSENKESVEKLES